VCVGVGVVGGSRGGGGLNGYVGCGGSERSWIPFAHSHFKFS